MVVLLILAGISIIILTGEQGIIKQAQEAKNKSIIGEEKEAIGVAYDGVKVKNMEEGVNSTKLEEELHNNGHTDATATGDSRIIVTFSNTGNSYEIDENGKIIGKIENADEKIINVLGDKIALTASGKIVTIEFKKPDFSGDEWGEMEIKTELNYINGVKKHYNFSYGPVCYIISNSNELYAWGRNNYGQLGIGNTENQSSPVKIGGISNVADVYSNRHSVIAKTNTGELYTWGVNDIGRLVMGNTGDQLSPVKMEGINNVVDDYFNFDYAIARTNTGELYAWGGNNAGQLGIGNTEYQLSPVKIEGISNVADVYCNGNSAIARTNTGKLYVWGKNSNDRLGIGNTADQLNPICLENIEKFICIFPELYTISKEGILQGMIIRES